VVGKVPEVEGKVAKPVGKVEIQLVRIENE
jgi:hypothetical protein